MSPLEMALFVLVVPALAAAVMLTAAGWAGRRAGLAGSGQAAVALALGAGVLAAQFHFAPPSFPPIEVTDRIPWLVAVAMLLGVCESVRPSPGWARWENRLLLTVLALGLILGPVLGADWPTRSALARQGGLVLARRGLGRVVVAARSVPEPGGHPGAGRHRRRALDRGTRLRRPAGVVGLPPRRGAPGRMGGVRRAHAAIGGVAGGPAECGRDSRPGGGGGGSGDRGFARV
jgi:hypothetical protein